MKIYKEKPGRKSKIDPNVTEKVLLENKDGIYDSETNSCVSRSHPIWNDISKQLNNKIIPSSLYVYACKLFKKLIDVDKDSELLEEEHNESHVDVNASVLDSTVNSSSAFDPLEFVVQYHKEEFDSLIEMVYYKRSTKNNKVSKRLWKILKAGVWEDSISRKVYDSTKLPCGFMFKNHYLPLSDEEGHIPNGM